MSHVESGLLGLIPKSMLLETIEHTTHSSYGKRGRGSFPDFTVRVKQKEWVDPSNIPDWLLGYRPRPKHAGVKPLTRRPVGQRA